MVDVGVDFGPDQGARNVGVFPRGETPGARIVGASPGKDSRCAEDGCSPDEDVYYVFDYYCIISA